MQRIDEAAAVPLWEAYRTERTVANRNRLVEHYVALPRIVARRVERRWQPLPRAVDCDDLEAAGMLGLIGAIEDRTPAVPAFFPFAWVCIANVIFEEIVGATFTHRFWRNGAYERESMPVRLLGDRPVIDSRTSPTQAVDDRDEAEHFLRRMGERTRKAVWLNVCCDQPFAELADVFGLHRQKLAGMVTKAIEHARRDAGVESDEKWKARTQGKSWRKTEELLGGLAVPRPEDAP